MRLHPLLASAAVLLALAAGVGPALAYDTIDCTHDRSVAERAICANRQLVVLDAQVTEKYTDIMLDASITRKIKSALHESQLTFLQRRDACGANVECLTEVMGRRTTRIDTYR